MENRSVLLSVIVFGVLSAWAPPSYAVLRVVATTPDLGSIAREVGGDRVEVTNLAKGTEDPHFVDAKPSFIRILNQADALIEGGADLEVGWLPPLVLNARNPKIQLGQPGRIVAAEVIRLLEVPTGPIDRSMGDVHPFGNPHFTLDPLNGKLIAGRVKERLCVLSAADCAIFTANAKQFEDKIDSRLALWQKQMAPLRGTKVVTYHKSFSYLAERFGLLVINTIEPKPGVPPSASHVRDLVAHMKAEGVRLILLEPNRERKTPAFLAQETGARVAYVPSMVQGSKEAMDYLSFFDHLVGTMLAAGQE
ncbi:MAG TPA: metal ABC transporter substrate-binding protein [Candidatus Methylomirabilis sp.]|nr:metal ABC transporter substrate-binding protein [Candidatus Methylomirabilis sp.]